MSDARPLTDPWAWRPSLASWHRRFGVFASRWRPAASLGLDGDGLAECLVAAAGRGEQWLVHPCASAITRDSSQQRLQSDVQLAARIAAYGNPQAQKITFPRDLWVWAPDGGTLLPAGIYDLETLGELARRRCSWPIALDVWCRTTGFPLERGWAAQPPIVPDEEAALQKEVRLFFRALAALRRFLCDCCDWLTSLTQVVVPLRGLKGRWESGSSTDLPGLIWLHLHGGLQILEGLVHETAHHYLFLSEAAGPLVDPSHTETYTSPLRPDPRPLRGILLAYHALAYICAFYADAARHGFDPRQCQQQLFSMRTKLATAQETLVVNRRFLTESGDEFFKQTKGVAQYSEC